MDTHQFRPPRSYSKHSGRLADSQSLLARTRSASDASIRVARNALLVTLWAAD